MVPNRCIACIALVVGFVLVDCNMQMAFFCHSQFPEQPCLHKKHPPKKQLHASDVVKTDRDGHMILVMSFDFVVKHDVTFVLSEGF